jgi:hypothetical protein
MLVFRFPEGCAAGDSMAPPVTPGSVSSWPRVAQSLGSTLSRLSSSRRVLTAALHPDYSQHFAQCFASLAGGQDRLGLRQREIIERSRQPDPLWN